MARDKKVFLIFNDSDWESDLKKARYYLSMGLADYHKVLFISFPPNRGNLQSRDLINRIVPKVRMIKDNLYVYEWPWWTLELYRFPYVKKTIKRIRACLLKNVVKKMFGKNPDHIITYFTYPSMFEFFGIFENAITIYNPYDMFSFMGSGHNAYIEDLENRYVPQFNFVLCPHHQLVSHFKQMNDNTIFFPHGVDFKLYSKATKSETVVPEEIAKINKPIIGYTGVINDRIDLILIQKILKTKSEWSIVMIGPLKLSEENKKFFDKLRKMSNFHWLGYQNPDLLPNFMKYFDIGIIPYKLINWVKWSSNPLKLHMYAAAGLPTVSCKLGNVEKFYDYNYVASAENEWVTLIQKALTEKNKDVRRKKRLSSAAENDWINRIKFLIGIIDGYREG